MLTQERLHSLLSYDPASGVFVWRESRGKAISGEKADAARHDGYIKITIDQKHYLGHRLAWFYVNGEWPEFLDHINRNRADNRLCNLRVVTRTENNQNKSTRLDNSSGVTGVSFDASRKRWTVRLKIAGKYKYFGRFESFSEAVSVRKTAEKQHFGEFAPA